MKTVTEILVDVSGSMKNTISSARKMLIEEVIPTMDFSDKIGIKTFTSSNKSPIIKSVLPLSITNKTQLKEAVEKITNCHGGTPIAAAIRNSVESLKEFMAFEKRIILLTDGQESDGGNYELEAQNAKRKGVNCEIHIIGIGLKPEAIKKAQRISSISGGTFSNVTFGNSYNTNSVKTSLTRFSSQFSTHTRSITPKQTHSTSQPVKKVEVKPIVKKEEPIIEKVKEVSTAKEETHSKEEIVKRVDDNSKKLETIVSQLNIITEKIESISKPSISNLEDEIEINEDKEFNEKIRKVSEQYVFEKLTDKYGKNINWLNSDGKESFSDHDFEVIDIDGTIEYYIDCKGTIGDKKTFMMTSNEWRLFLNQTKNYQIFLVTNVLKSPKITKIDNLLDWILKGKVVPYSEKNIRLKAERIYFTIIE